MENNNTFENFLEDQLSNARKEKIVSSQNNVNGKSNNSGICANFRSVTYPSLEDVKTLENSDNLLNVTKKTSFKKKKDQFLSSTPIKIQDCSDYYNGCKNIRHICTYCHKIFKSNGKLNNHVYSHTGERPFNCSHCGKAFSSKFKLVRHILIHSEIRKYICHICDRTFLRNDHLKNHYKVHDPQKKIYKCPKPNCVKEYSSLMSHKKHMALHNVEEGDLKCLICNVKYETKEEILIHLKSHSSSRVFKSKSDKKFKCEFCDRLFLTRKDVTRHLVVHTGERDFLCQFCPQRFGRKDHLIRHIKKGHCNEGFLNKNETRTKEPENDKKIESKKFNDSPKNIEKTFMENSDITSIDLFASEVDAKAVLLPCSSLLTPTVNDNSYPTERRYSKTHIVITVHDKPSKSHKKKTFKDCESTKKIFPKNNYSSYGKMKKQICFAKEKNLTTEILFQKVPNILVLPNNSFILLRNQPCFNKNIKKENEENISLIAKPETSLKVTEQFKEKKLLESSLAQSFNACESLNLNFNHEPDAFQSTSFCLEEFSENNNSYNFQSNLTPFNSTLNESSSQFSFEVLNQNNLSSKSESYSSSFFLNNFNNAVQYSVGSKSNLHLEAQQQCKSVETIKSLKFSIKPEERKTGNETEKEILFETNGSVILNQFKGQPAENLTENTDVINNALNQTTDSCGLEVFRNLQTTENPIFYPLPGFSQAFHDSTVDLK